MIVENLPLPPIYYHSREASYWREDVVGGWIKINETSAKNFVADYGYRKKNEGDANAEADECLLKVQGSQNVAFVGPLAGFDAGVYEMSGKRVLATESPKFIVPKPGEWLVLERLFEGMFLDGDLDQRPYFYAWLKAAMETFHARKWRASQLLAFAGEAGSGKSLTQNLITLMFGGRSAKPYTFMRGDTTFNSQLFAGEHLILEDESESVDIRSRRHFAAMMKTFLAAKDQQWHGKNREALILRPLWRMTVSLNDEPERLLVLPPLDEDVRDKIIVLKVGKRPMPMRTGTPDLDQAFWDRLVGELPAFLYFLEGWAVPEEIADTRYGVRAFQHPEIVEMLGETTPETRLLEMIDTEIYGNHFNRVVWSGTAAELTRRLLRETAQCRDEARRMFGWGGACGTLLGRLEKSTAPHAAGRVASTRINGVRHWTIQPPTLTESHATPLPEG